MFCRKKPQEVRVILDKPLVLAVDLTGENGDAAGLQTQLTRIEAKLDALIVQGPVLEALRARVQQMTQDLAGSGAALQDATAGNQPPRT